MKRMAVIGLWLITLGSVWFTPAWAQEDEAASLTLIASEFHEKTAGAADGQGWNLFANGQLNQWFRFPADGTYTVIIMARGESANGEWPVLKVMLDSRLVSEHVINSTDWLPITTSLSTSEGYHPLALVFENDGTAGTEDRNLRISTMAILSPEKTPAVETMTAQDADELSLRKRAEWETRMDAMIERERRGRMVIWIKDKNGEPISNAVVQVQQLRHAFPFGVALSSSMFGGSATGQQVAAYRAKAAEYFNAAVPENALKWEQYEPAQGEIKSAALNAMISWASSNRISLRGHCLFWGCHVPAWTTDLPLSNLVEAIEHRVQRVITRYQDVMPDMDIVNEPMHCPLFAGRFETDPIEQAFSLSRDASPLVRRYVNEYGVMEAKGVAAYAQWIRDALDKNVAISGIGVQAHFTDQADPDYLTSALTQLASFGLPIKITEFDCASSNEAVQIQTLRDVYRAAFAHPAVEGIYMWGFWEACHWRPNAAILNQDFSERKTAAAYRSLVFKRWWTRQQGFSDEVGRFECPAFFGDYAIHVIHPDGSTMDATMTLTKQEQAAVVNVQFDMDISQFKTPDDLGKPVRR